jgi:archaemetzincin
MKKIIYIQQIGEIDRIILRLLKKSLKFFFKKFNLLVEILDEKISLTINEFNTSKNKFNADLIMNKFYNESQISTNFRILGVMDEDIYVGTYNFIFGTAKNPQKAFSQLSPIALISITRLREEFWRKSANQALFELRILKEAIHELGHTFGLNHCENECVMIFSNWIGDTDKKPPHYCEDCSSKVVKFLDEI